MKGALTQHKSGSLRELWSLSFPLMISLISGNLMLFCDRLILARYSQTAMNAAALATVWCLLIHYSLHTMAMIAKVFVGRFNGAEEKERVGEPVWQMIWLSIGSFLLFIPLAHFAPPFVIPKGVLWEMGSSYYRILTYFGPIFPLQAAVSAFFVGTGNVRTVTKVAIASNILNILLDLALIFGIPGVTPSIGCSGAAWATGLSQLFQVCCLMAFFLSATNRSTYGTHKWRFQPKLFRECLRIGMPSAASQFIELGAWVLLMRMMTALSQNHLTVLAIGHSCFLLVGFFANGLHQGVTAISANYLGANRPDIVRQVIKSAIRLLILISLILTLPLLIQPQLLINSFLSRNGVIASPDLVFFLKITLLWVWLYFLFDGAVWVLAGALTAGGDTRFIMIANSVTAWLFAILPAYLLLVRLGASPAFTWGASALYAVLNCIAFTIRYRTNRWSVV